MIATTTTAVRSAVARIALGFIGASVAAVFASRLSEMSGRTREYRRLRVAVTIASAAHDLLGVLDFRAPAGEHDPEAEDFARPTAKGQPTTSRLWPPSGTGSGTPPNNAQ